MADLQRHIPSMVDGLETRFLVVSEHSAYHHGEQSIASTIIGMAQDFVGSNNINLLLPNGQFGTPHQGGKIMKVQGTYTLDFLQSHVPVPKG
ncbi:DNA topoisomerase 2 [Vitis vinifera]|uniref:DNA topoisomerase (ATP-hydrolyzing) n=1 Tax=Vitis vinifera TaxID=29760 RepID=A0A438BXJ3_VITVI|nr:DNA topoisomerase 2 [Vitis vinifera]